MSKRAASTKIVCPGNDVLAQLAAGSLAEARAEPLFVHIAGCKRCQDIVDQLGKRAGGLLGAAIKTETRKSTARTLDSLIRNAQQLKAGSDPELTLNSSKRSNTSSGRPKISVDGFVDRLKKSELFSDAEVKGFVGEIGTDDSGVLAQALISRGKLTSFQAKSLLRGKGFVLGNYVILEKLGQGGMGSVFKARHRRMGRVVCLKVMNPRGLKSDELLHRFRQEARTVGALSHPNIVVAHDADEARGIPFLVMEYIEGNDLAKHVAANGPMPVGQTMQLLAQAAQALSYAHSEGVVHRDIKPHNLLLSEQTESGSTVSSVKVLDMGLARFDAFMTDNPDASVHAGMTSTGVIMGTVDYMAPEQAICTRDADNRSDIYSLGCTLHFLLTGKPIYDGETIMARLVAHRETPIPSLAAARADVWPELDAVFRKMVAKKAEARYQSMEELLVDLNLMNAGKPPTHAALPATTAPAVERDATVETVDEEPQPVKKQGLGSLSMWIPVVGLTVVTLITVAFMEADTAKPSAGGESATVEREMFGHPATLRNGGKGRAVFLLPTRKGSHFDDKQYLAFRNSLDQDIELTVMGLNNLPVRPMYGKVEPFKPDILLSDYRTEDFDAIFIVDGELNELRKGNAETRARLEAIFKTAFADGQVVSVVRDACHVVGDSGKLQGMKWKQQRGFTVGTRNDIAGSFVKIQNDHNIADATDMIFGQLLKDRAKQVAR